MTISQIQLILRRGDSRIAPTSLTATHPEIPLVLLLTLVLITFAYSVSIGQDKIPVVVSILPQLEFIEQIGGQSVEPVVLVPPNASPEAYEPTPAQMKELTRARLFFKVGTNLDFELSLLDKIADLNPNLKIIDCSKGIEVASESDDKSPHSEKETFGGHHHGGKDPHIWSSMRNAQIMIDNIAAGLVAVDSAHKNIYLSNAANYKKLLADLDKSLTTLFANIENRKFIVFHPAWGYFARDYDLTQLAVEMEGKEPSIGDIRRLIILAKSNDIKSVFASPQFNVESARTIAREIEGKVEYIDPLAKDYLQNMQTVADKIAKSLELK